MALVPTTIKLEILPRHRNGCDFGRDQRILIRYENKCIAHRASFTSWGGIGASRDYIPSAVEGFHTNEAGSPSSIEMFTGRISAEKLYGKAADMSKYLGVAKGEVIGALQAWIEYNRRKNKATVLLTKEFSA